MDKLIDHFPFKKILYLTWYEAALAHLLLFKYLIQKTSNNVYFLISQQGILLKASTPDYLKKAEDEITKLFTSKIDELQISGSADFYEHIIEDIKEQTDRLKENRDCPYINLVYSDKIRNSCLAMKKHGYTKPYENWECRQRQHKGFCLLIVRPQHRWKQIASNVISLIKKRQSNHQKQTDVSWPVDICYEKFIWFYLKQSFQNFKKSIEIKEKKNQKRLTIVIKRQIAQFNDLEKEIDCLNFFYIPTRPLIGIKEKQKIVCLSPLEVERITELIYHEFGLPNFVRQLRKKMSGFLVIGSTDITQYYESIETGELPNKNHFSFSDKQDISCINPSKITTVLKLGQRHWIVNFSGTNYVQIKMQKPMKENMVKVMKMRLPCLPKYYFWYEKEESYYIVRNYYTEKLVDIFQRAALNKKLFFLYSLLSIVRELHDRDIAIGPSLESVYLDEKRLIVEPQQVGSKIQDQQILLNMLPSYFQHVHDEQIRNSLVAKKNQGMNNLLTYIEQVMDDTI